MRSFLNFVSRCIKAPEVSTTEEVVTAAPKMAAQREKKKKKRVKVGTPFTMTPEWKPSLYVISEDNVTAEKREKIPPEVAATAEDRAVKRKSTAGSRSKVHVRSYSSDDMGRISGPVVIPTFSPIPFMI